MGSMKLIHPSACVNSINVKATRLSTALVSSVGRLKN